MADMALAAPAPIEGGLTDAQIDAAFTPEAVAAEGTGETETETVTETETGAAETTTQETAEEAATEETEAATAEGEGEATAETAAPAVDPNVPEGVTVRAGKDGKKEWVWPEERAKRIYETYKMVRQVESVFGEEVTLEALQARNKAYQGAQMLQTHFMSGRPEYHDRIIEHFIQQGERAMRDENGQPIDGAEDPMISFAERMPEVLLQRNPAAFQQMRDTLMRHFLPAYIRLKSQSTDQRAKQELISAQWLMRDLLGDYEKPGAPGAQDDISARESELAAREQRIQQFNSQREAERNASWKTDTKKAWQGAIGESVVANVKSVENPFKAFPLQFEDLKAKLNSKVLESMRGDAEWQANINRLQERALLSRSEQIRSEAQAQIIRAHQIKANAVLESVAPKIISEYTRWLKANSDATHQRRAEAATHREPGSTGTPVRKSIVAIKPSGDGSLTQDEWAKALDALPL